MIFTLTSVSLMRTSVTKGFVSFKGLTKTSSRSGETYFGRESFSSAFTRTRTYAGELILGSRVGLANSADLEKVPVRVSKETTRLGPKFVRFRKELRPLRKQILIRGATLRYSDREGMVDAVGV